MNSDLDAFRGDFSTDRLGKLISPNTASATLECQRVHRSENFSTALEHMFERMEKRKISI